MDVRHCASLAAAAGAALDSRFDAFRRDSGGAPPRISPTAAPRSAVKRAPGASPLPRAAAAGAAFEAFMFTPRTAK
jgi:hypothetical protein